MFDISNLPFRDQFEAAVIVSGVCLAAAVVLREWFMDREIRIVARILGAAGWAVVVTFAWRMTETNETLATQLMVKQNQQDATQIAKVESVSLVTKRGTVVEIGDIHGVRTVFGIDRNGGTRDRGNRFGNLAVNGRQSREARNNFWLMDAISNVHEWAGANVFRSAEDFRSDAEQF